MAKRGTLKYRKITRTPQSGENVVRHHRNRPRSEL